MCKSSLARTIVVIGAAVLLSLSSACVTPRTPTPPRPLRAATSSGPDLSRLQLPIRGVRYQPAPTDYIGNQGNCAKYFGSDFFNDDFPGFWSRANGGRGDIATMANWLGVNFVGLYNWDPTRAGIDFSSFGLGPVPAGTGGHIGFLNECQAHGIVVAIPFSNPLAQNVTSWGAQAVFNIMQEIYNGGSTPHPAVGMWTIANEYNQGGGPTAAQIAQIAQVILWGEQQLGTSVQLPIASPTSYAPANSPGISPTQALQTAFAATSSFSATINGSSVTIPALPTDFFTSRYVVATNPQNPGSAPPGSPSPWTVSGFIAAANAAFPGQPIWFSEVGIGEQNSCNGWPSTCSPSFLQQGNFLLNQVQTIETAAKSNSTVLGSSVYEYTPDYQNLPITSTNYTFSLLTDLKETSSSTTFYTPASAPCSPACSSSPPCTYSQNQPYPVQCLYTYKPVYQLLKRLWKPTFPPGPFVKSFCPASSAGAQTGGPGSL